MKRFKNTQRRAAALISMVAVVAALPATLSAAAMEGDTPPAWPYAQDIPQAEPATISLAGEYPADISRFLAAEGAARAEINAQGTDILYLSRVTGVNQVWRVSADGGQSQQLTFGGGVTFFRWHPDGEHLIYGADTAGDEKEAFYLLSKDGTSEKLLLERSSAYRSFGAFNGDGSEFVFASTERNGRDFDIWVGSLTGGARLVYEGSFGFFPLEWQPGGSLVLVGETRGEDGQNLHLLDLSTGEMRPLRVPEVSADYRDGTFSDDGKSIYLSHNEGREMLAVAKMDIATGTFEVIAEANADLDTLSASVSKAGTTLAWTVNNGGYSLLRTKDMASDTVTEVEGLPEGVYSVSMSEDGKTLAVNVYGPRIPGDIYVVKDGKASRVFAGSLAGIKADTLSVPKSVSFAARDGLTLHGLLYSPQGTAPKAGYPVVVNVHGGPTAQARPRYNPLIQYLVGRGIAVLDVNVRGSTGYGKQYARLDNQEKRLDSVADLTDAVKWMGTEPSLNADKVAVMGGSYGGYMVNAVMGAYPGVFKAGASFVGVSDWVRALEGASPALKASDRIEYGDISDEKWQAFYRDNSPINTVGNITAPMFFEHGANDPRDPVTESDRMVKALRDKGQDVIYLRFADEGHSVAKKSNRYIMFRRLAAFLVEHLSEE